MPQSKPQREPEVDQNFFSRPRLSPYQADISRAQLVPPGAISPFSSAISSPAGSAAGFAISLLTLPCFTELVAGVTQGHRQGY